MKPLAPLPKPQLLHKPGMHKDIFTEYKSVTDIKIMNSLGASIHNNNHFGTNYHSLFNSRQGTSTKWYDYNYIITYYKNNLIGNYIDNVLKAYIQSITDKYKTYSNLNKIAEWLNPFTEKTETLAGMIHTVLLYEFDYFIYLLQTDNNLIKDIKQKKPLKLRLIYFHSLLQTNTTLEDIERKILESHSTTSKYLKYKMKYIALKKKLNL
jgi:hypothetical protein